ncbi:hypothetical protein G9A89_001065 [Geosiphon pyriformis]|nr:hypothetical protein G9A89_001065 [Geosiphon pyriformis]
MLDHLVSDSSLIVDPIDIKNNVDKIMEDWTKKRIVPYNISDLWQHQYLPLDYVDNNAFFGVMNAISYEDLVHVIKDLPDSKAAEAWVSIIPKFYKWKDILTNTKLITLIETTYKILFKILSDRILLACNVFDVLHSNNFSVLKGTTTQSPIFAISSVVENALEKNHEFWLVLQDMWKAYNSVHDSLDQGEMFSPLLWRIFYDPLLCEVKRQESLCEYCIDSRFVAKTDSLPVIELQLLDVSGLDGVFWLKQCLFISNLNVIEVYIDKSLKNFGMQEMECGAAAYFLDVDLCIGIRVSGLVSFILAELQVIVLALECVLFCSSIVVYLNSQIALGACAAESVLASLDFHNHCWMKTVNCACWKVELGFAIINKGMIGDVDWVCTALVWHSNLHIAAGFTSKFTTGLYLYFLKALHHCLLVVMQKCLYNRDYLSVLCLHCREVKSSDHFFVCAFDSEVHKNLLTSHLVKWHAVSDLGLSLSQISQVLSLCISDNVLYTTLCKNFLFRDWYLEAVSVLDDAKFAERIIINFV